MYHTQTLQMRLRCLPIWQQRTQCLTVPDATTSTDGVVKKAAASADIASIGGTSTSSASAVTAITFSASDASNPTKAEIIVTLNQMAQQINHLKSVLRSAGILT